MRRLKTIQEKEKLNEVFALDEKGKGGANHEYLVVSDRGVCKVSMEQKISFQNGARNEEGSRHGVLDVDLLEIVRDRLRGFQSGEFACGYNAEALKCVEKALYYMNQRVEDRIARNVLGKDEK